jgi:LmbE family N-acetylglucosaminyl deacetylase
MARKKTVLVFEAHADDMEFMAGGTIAKFTDRGHEAHVVCATNNEKGSFELSADELRAVRDREVRSAAKVLGVAGVTLLGYPDGELTEKAPRPVLRGRFMRIIRQLRPDIMITWDPFAPYEFHPDHRAVAWAALEAASFSNYPLFCPEQLEEGLGPHYVGEQWFFATAPRDVNKYVDIGDYIDKKIESLYRHESQMVMMVTAAQHAMRASGLSFPGLDTLDPHDFKAAIAAEVRAMAQEAGRPVGILYAEQFRCTRFEGVERFAPGQTIEEDV